MSEETDKIRTNAADSINQANAIDEQKPIDVEEAITELENITLPALQTATTSVQTALDTLKKSLTE